MRMPSSARGNIEHLAWRWTVYARRLVDRTLLFETVFFYSMLWVGLLGGPGLSPLFLCLPLRLLLPVVFFFVGVLPLVFGLICASEGTLEEAEQDRQVFFQAHPVGWIIKRWRARC